MLLCTNEKQQEGFDLSDFLASLFLYISFRSYMKDNSDQLPETIFVYRHADRTVDIGHIKQIETGAIRVNLRSNFHAGLDCHSISMHVLL